MKYSLLCTNTILSMIFKKAATAMKAISDEGHQLGSKGRAREASQLFLSLPHMQLGGRLIRNLLH